MFRRGKNPNMTLNFISTINHIHHKILFLAFIMQMQLQLVRLQVALWLRQPPEPITLATDLNNAGITNSSNGR